MRIHIPNTLTQFGSPSASRRPLLETIESEADGLVRYKALRALGRIVSERRLKVDRERSLRLALANVVEHFRLLGLRAAFEASLLLGPTVSAGRIAPERLLVGLLDDKLRQSLERTFRLIKIAMPGEDVHRIHDAIRSERPTYARG